MCQKQIEKPVTFANCVLSNQANYRWLNRSVAIHFMVATCSLTAAGLDYWDTNRSLFLRESAMLDFNAKVGQGSQTLTLSGGGVGGVGVGGNNS